MSPPPRRSLGRDIADDLRRRILASEFPPRSKLPSEAEIGAHYGVSRVTVRAALQLMASRGLADIRHGSGSYVAATNEGIRASLQELRSITETIREFGHEPSMRRIAITERVASEREAERLGVSVDERVIAIERSVLADGEVVAYSYDVLPAALLPPDAADSLGIGSVFAALTAHDLEPERAVAEVHAVAAADLPFSLEEQGDGLFLLLDQLHETKGGQPVLYSRTYFVEGRFQFVILRTR